MRCNRIVLLRRSQEGRGQALASGARLRPHQPGQHGGAVGHAALQMLHSLIFDFPEPPHRPPGPILRRHCRQGRRLRAHGRLGAAAAEGVGHPELGARPALRAGAMAASCSSGRPTPTRDTVGEAAADALRARSGRAGGRPRGHKVGGPGGCPGPLEARSWAATSLGFYRSATDAEKPDPELIHALQQPERNRPIEGERR